MSRIVWLNLKKETRNKLHFENKQNIERIRKGFGNVDVHTIDGGQQIDIRIYAEGKQVHLEFKGWPEWSDVWTAIDRHPLTTHASGPCISMRKYTNYSQQGPINAPWSRRYPWKETIQKQSDWSIAENLLKPQEDYSSLDMQRFASEWLARHPNEDAPKKGWARAADYEARQILARSAG